MLRRVVWYTNFEVYDLLIKDGDRKFYIGKKVSLLLE